MHNLPPIHALLFPFAPQGHFTLPAIKIGLEILAHLSEKDREQVRSTCKRWTQLLDTIHLIEKYNHKLMKPQEVKQEAAHYLQNAHHLETQQSFLLAIVKLSINCQKMKKAAANALMILKKTKFSFVGCDLKGIQVPGVRLRRALLNEANFSKANLQGADLSDCSLEGTRFDQANLEAIHLGQAPYLIHQSQVLALALGAREKYAASMDKHRIYLWNLEDLSVQWLPNSRISDPHFRDNAGNAFLLFASHHQWLFRAHQEGELEVWRLEGKYPSVSLTIDDIKSFSFLALTSDDQYLVVIGNLTSTAKQLPVSKISVWQIADSGSKLILTPISEEIVEHQHPLACSFDSHSSQLAMAFQLEDTNYLRLYAIPSLKKSKEVKEELDGAPQVYIDRLLFTPQGDSLLIAKSLSSELQRDVVVWKIKEGLFRPLFSEDKGISDWQFLSQSQCLAYLTPGGFFCMRDALKYSIKSSEEVPLLFGQGSQVLRLGKEHLYSLSENKGLIIPIHKFAKRKETGVRGELANVYFSANAQTFYVIDKSGKIYAKQTSTGKTLFCKPLTDNELQEARYVFTTHQIAQLTLSQNLHPYFAGNPFLVRDLIFSGHRLITTITLFRLQDQQTYFKLEKNCFACALSPNGHYLVLATLKELEIWDIASKQILGKVCFPSGKIVTSLILSSTIFPKALLLVMETVDAGSKARNATLWEIKWRKSTMERKASFPRIFNATFIGSSRLILQEAEALTVWHCKNIEQERIEIKALKNFAVTPEGSLLVANKERGSMHEKILPFHEIELWNLDHKKKLDHKSLPISSPLFLLADTLSLSSVFIAPNARYVICWQLASKKVYTWKIRKGKLHLLWTIPKQLEGKNVSFTNAQGLSSKNKLLLAQLKNALQHVIYLTEEEFFRPYDLEVKKPNTEP